MKSITAKPKVINGLYREHLAHIKYGKSENF